MNATSTEKIVMSRSTAIALIVRLEILDIPYVQSKECRHQLIEFLSDILVKNNEDCNNSYIEIDLGDVKHYISDSDMATKILRYYGEVF